MPIRATRALLAAALNGSLDSAPMEKDPVFGFMVPTSAPGVDEKILNPRAAWRDAGAYDVQASRLAGMFVENFKIFEPFVSAATRAAAPKA